MGGDAQAIFAAVVLDDEFPQVAQQVRAGYAAALVPGFWRNAAGLFTGKVVRVGSHDEK
jgi:hypothetical protein